MSTVRETKLTSDSTIERWLDAYRRMAAIRAFDERVNELYRSAKMPGLAHLGHGHCLAKGAAADRMFAELLGKEPGYCRGKGGSMHIADHENGNLGANAIVAGSTGIATGAAMSAKMRSTAQVAVCFFGEGALGQGVLYEVMNMASLWKLPVIYACENNLYNEYTHYSETTAGDLVARGEAFGIPAEQVDGQDVRAVFDAAELAVERARRGDGPTFLVLNTYRFHGHHVGDVDRSYYRSEAEETEWKSRRDPIELLAEWLQEQGVAAEMLAQIRSEAQQEVDAGIQFALAAPFPDESEVDQHVFA